MKIKPNNTVVIKHETLQNKTIVDIAGQPSPKKNS